MMTQHFVESVNNEMLLAFPASIEHDSGMASPNRVPRRATLIRKQFAARLQQARIAAGYKTKAEFARAIGIEAETYRGWERGRTEPGISEINAILTAADVSAEYLVSGRLPPPPIVRVENDRDETVPLLPLPAATR